MLNLPTLTPPQMEPCGIQSYYSPTRFGLHFCGQTQPQGKDSQPYTALNLDAPSTSIAQAMFEAAKEAAACSEDEADYIVDLQIDNNCDRDFWTNRQLAPIAIKAAIDARTEATA